ncbi:MAG: FAD binding domain-containing protein [Ardenticatenaceae bacterium]|nr:FAD binding domain-containing protein [Ardenticatenaceae bacterium]
MALWEKYHLPESVEAALIDLSRYEGNARVIAGGTDLLLELQQGRKPPGAALVDITRIPELREIRQHGDLITVGAAVTHTEIVASTLLAQRATCLVESCGVIGGPQVRNVATLGGNVAHALPAGDGPISLVALAAEVEVATAAGRKWHPIRSLFQGPGRSAVDQGRELITRFRFRATGSHAGTAFKRIMRPQGVALPIMGMAVWVEFDNDYETVADVRIGLGPAGPTPMRATEAEAYLRGKRVHDEVLQEVSRHTLAQARLRTSKHRATRSYRVELIDVLVRRNFEAICRRIGQTEVVPEGVGWA